MMNEFVLKPIGVIHSKRTYRYETPRQGVLSDNNHSMIELKPHNNYEKAVKDLSGFERIWVIYWFHLNSNWKPLVNPPRHSDTKIGVFATRSPHRPNNIGISCVKLEKVDGLKIFISESDILDGTPVLDIKPYLPYSDSFPDAGAGWIKNNDEAEYNIEYQEDAITQIEWLKRNAGIELMNFIQLQLEYKPGDSTRKRITKTGDINILAYRTWRVLYIISENNNRVSVLQIRSGYTEDELNNSIEDKYGDKTLHKEFQSKFNRQ